jgi:hypothetical protein
VAGGAARPRRGRMLRHMAARVAGPASAPPRCRSPRVESRLPATAAASNRGRLEPRPGASVERPRATSARRCPPTLANDRYGSSNRGGGRRRTLPQALDGQNPRQWVRGDAQARQFRPPRPNPAAPTSRAAGAWPVVLPHRSIARKPGPGLRVAQPRPPGLPGRRVAGRRPSGGGRRSPRGRLPARGATARRPRTPAAHPRAPHGAARRSGPHRDAVRHCPADRG